MWLSPATFGHWAGSAIISHTASCGEAAMPEEQIGVVDEYLPGSA
jgi:hypothetical protein